jgi:glycerophosphoryl diester phosphodiesterase
MSFDPRPVSLLRTSAPDICRGIVAERHYDHPEWSFLTAPQKRALAWMLHAPSSRPQFLAYHVNDLPAAVPTCAHLVGLPILTWTVRTPAQREIAKRNADQMIFEGFRA